MGRWSWALGVVGLRGHRACPEHLVLAWMNAWDSSCMVPRAMCGVRSLLVIATCLLHHCSTSPAAFPVHAFSQVAFPDGHRTLCLIPARFHKKLWIKNGSYVILDNVEGADAAVTGQIATVLYANHVKQLKKMEGVW